MDLQSVGDRRGSEGGEEDRFTEMSQRRKKKKRWFKGFVFMLNGLFPRVQNTQPAGAMSSKRVNVINNARLICFRYFKLFGP